MVKWGQMLLTQKLMPLWHKVRGKLTKRAIIISSFVLICVLYGIAFFPRTVEFSYANATCVPQLSILPRILKSNTENDYTISTTDEVKVFDYPVLAKSVCVDAIAIPKEGRYKIGLSPFGGLIAKKNFVIVTKSNPAVSIEALNRPVPVSRPLMLALSRPDSIFTYKVIANQKTTTCDTVDAKLLCDLGKIGLSHDSSYSFSLDRYFGDQKVETIVQQEIKTLSAVMVTSSSVVDNQTIYDKPTSFSFTTNKSLESAKVAVFLKTGDTQKVVNSTVEIIDKDIVVHLSDQLARSASYVVSLTDVLAVDGSSLSNIYSTTVNVSGGPKVTRINVGTTGVSANATLTIQLDQPIHDDQDITKFVTFTGGAAAISKAGDKIIVKLSNLPRCTDFTVKINKGLRSNHDIESTFEWQHASRTICHTIATIGYSVQGRPINAYYFGSGSATVLYTGAIHGNELSSKYTMERWINELEVKAREIPADRQIVVVPIVNPDGIVRASRNNANKVNLNRNFPTYNWSSNTVVSGGGVEAGAGGPVALSEPESRVLASFTLKLQPRFVVTHHSKGSLVNSNDVGTSIELGKQYAQLAGYRYISNAATTATFGFEMTGTYEDWLLERGTPAILIELNTDTGIHFTQNRAAMWAMLRG